MNGDKDMIYVFTLSILTRDLADIVVVHSCDKYRLLCIQKRWQWVVNGVVCLVRDLRYVGYVLIIWYVCFDREGWTMNMVHAEKGLC